MADADTSILSARRNDMCFCPGCSHGLVLERLAAAIDRIGRQHDEVCIVSDIGCIGMADRYFRCHTFHGLHGRSITYAEGIQQARPDLLVVVLIGDGGCGIGTAHLVHAARRNAGIKVVVCNNFNFGMTGGQHSPTTPTCGCTETTPDGAGDRPFDICATAAANGAAYAARFSAHDSQATDHFGAALSTSGFALVDVWELCSAYYVTANRLTPPGLIELSQRLGMSFGVLASRPREAAPAARRPRSEPPPEAPGRPIALRWQGRTEICVAGSAGQRIRSAVGVIGEILVAGGVYAAQQDDFPVTVRKGHSLSNLVLSNQPIRYCGVDEPDLLIVLSGDGLARLGPSPAMRRDALVMLDQRLEAAGPLAAARRLDLEDMERRAGRASASLAVLTGGLLACGWIDGATLMSAAESALSGKYREDNLRAIGVGAEWSAANARGLERPAATPLRKLT